MSSPFPRHITTHEDEQIYAMEEAAFWLSRIESQNTDIDIKNITTQLSQDKEKYTEDYLEYHLHEIAIDDYLWNNVETIKELFRTESLDKRVKILDSIRDDIMDRFGHYKPEKPTYDELENYIKKALIKSKNEGDAPGVYYEDLEIN